MSATDPPALTAPAVVTIDLHRGHLDARVATLPLPAVSAAALLDRVVPMLEDFRALGVPIVHLVTAYRDRAEILSNPYWALQSGRPGSTRTAIAEHNLIGMPGLELMPGVRGEGDIVIDTKKRYDCFVGTDLEFVLRSMGRHTLLVAGVNTNSCVLATSVAASVRDFSVVVLEDAVDSMMGEQAHAAALSLLGASFAVVTSGRAALEAIVRSLPEPAGHDV
jgi:nicotinamidase-related amidase